MLNELRTDIPQPQLAGQTAIPVRRGYIPLRPRAYSMGHPGTTDSSISTSAPTQPTQATIAPTQPTEATIAPTQPTEATAAPTQPTQPTEATPPPTDPTEPTDTTETTSG